MMSWERRIVTDHRGRPFNPNLPERNARIRAARLAGEKLMVLAVEYSLTASAICAICRGRAGYKIQARGEEEK